MTIQTTILNTRTSDETDIIDITGDISSVVSTTPIQEGTVTVFINGSTAGVTTIEYESGVVSDLKDLFKKIIPENIPYQHNLRWGDGNGYSHVRASLLKPSLSIPLKDHKMILGTWQQIVLIDFDNRPRQRQFIVQIMGD